MKSMIRWFFLISSWFIFSAIVDAEITAIATRPGSPAGSVQTNQGGRFTGDADFTFSTTTNRVYVAGMSIGTTTAGDLLTLSGASSIARIRFIDTENHEWFIGSDSPNMYALYDVTASSWIWRSNTNGTHFYGPAPWCDVKAFGAQGDGVTDDTPAIRAAHAYLPSAGGTIFFPPGNYVVTSTITISKPNVRMMGSGRRQRIATNSATKISMTGTGNVIHVEAQGFMLENLAFDYPAQDGTVIYSATAADGMIRECHFVGISRRGNAIVIADGSAWRFDRVVIEYFDIGIDLQSNNGNTNLYNTNVSLCNVGTRIGINGGSQNVDFVNPDYEDFTDSAISILNAGSVNINGGYFEGENAGDSYIVRVGTGSDTVYNFSFRDAYVNGLTTNNYAIQLNRVDDAVIENVRAVNMATGFINNSAASVSGIKISNVNTNGTLINSQSGIVSILDTSGNWGLGPNIPQTKADISGGTLTVRGGGIVIASTTHGIQWPDGTVQVSSPSAIGGAADNLGNHTATTMITAGYGISASTIVANIITGTTIYMGGGAEVASDDKPGLAFINDYDTGLAYGTASGFGTNNDIAVVQSSATSFSFDHLSASIQQFLTSQRGLASSPAIAISDSNMGIFQTIDTAEGSIGFSYLGIERMRIGSGVVIGTPTIDVPLAKLTVVNSDDSTVIISSINAVQASVTGTDVFMSFRSNTGEEANITGSGVAGVIAYNTFMGSHWTKIDGKIPEVGMVLEMTGKVLDGHSERLARTKISNTPGSKKVYGVYAGKGNNGKHLAAGLGSFVILVSDANGDIEAGDLLESDGRGYARKQSDDIIRSSTIGKAVVDVVWSKEKKKIKRIGCVLYAG